MSDPVVALLAASKSQKIGYSLSRKLLVNIRPGNVSYGQLSSGYTPSTEPTSGSWDADWIASGPYSSVYSAIQGYVTYWEADGGTIDLGAFTTDCYNPIFGAGYTFSTAPFSVTGNNSSWPFSDFGGAIGNGWGCSGGTAANANLAMAKNNELFSLPYFIAEIQTGLGWANGGSQAYVNPGTTYIQTVVTILSQGSIGSGKVIGTGQDINLPFPSTTPGQALGTTLMAADTIVPVIGLPISLWLRAMGQKLGTTSGTTS